MDIVSPLADKTIIDATFGAGGYSSRFLQLGASVIAIDRDPNAGSHAESCANKYDEKFRFISNRFSKIDECCNTAVDAVVLDLGVSSVQIDDETRGFSFTSDGPLDMRMECNGVSAKDVVNHAEPSDLTRIIGILGEDKRASSISSAIVKRRSQQPFATTLDLAKVIEEVNPRKAKDRIHPATRTFQALRIFVNDELNELCKALYASERILKPKGHLCVVAFHSLEDKIVKKFFKHASEQDTTSRHLPPTAARTLTFKQDNRGIRKPKESEIDSNPRSRSAKLRYAIRLESDPQPFDISIFGLPNLPSLQSIRSTV